MIIEFDKHHKETIQKSWLKLFEQCLTYSITFSAMIRSKLKRFSLKTTLALILFKCKMHRQKNKRICNLKITEKNWKFQINISTCWQSYLEFHRWKKREIPNVFEAFCFFFFVFCFACNRFRVLESNCSFSIGQLSDCPLSGSSVRLRLRLCFRIGLVLVLWLCMCGTCGTVQCVVRTTKWKSKWKSRFNKYQLGLGLFAKTFARLSAKLCLALPLPLVMGMGMGMGVSVGVAQFGCVMWVWPTIASYWNATATRCTDWPGPGERALCSRA